MPVKSIGYMPSARPRRGESGAAIILAMLTLALVAGLASFILIDYAAAVASISGRHDQAQARLLARGAIDWARNVLAEDARTTAIDYTGENWAIHVPATPVEEGEVGGEIEDMSGHFDLNSLVNMGVASPDQVPAFERLLEELGVPAKDASALAASLVETIVVGNVVTPFGDAESGGHSTLAPPRVFAASPLIDIDELYLIRGYSVDLVNRLRPYVAALPAAAPLNVNTASAEVLAAALPGLGLDDARILLAKRQAVPFKDVGDFIAHLPRTSVTPETTRLSVTSRYFMATARARFGQATTLVQVLLDRKNVWPEIIWQKIL